MEKKREKEDAVAAKLGTKGYDEKERNTKKKTDARGVESALGFDLEPMNQ